MIIRKCVVCGKDFPVNSIKNTKALTCSPECAEKRLQMLNRFRINKLITITEKKILRHCKYCGKEFETTKSSGKKYCSAECLNNAKNFTPKPKSNLDLIIEQANQCGLSYGKYRAALNQGKTFEELKKL